MNRSLMFIAKYFDGIVPEGIANPFINNRIDELFVYVGRRIENGAFKDAISDIFEFIRNANKFFDTNQPWITRTTDKNA